MGSAETVAIPNGPPISGGGATFPRTCDSTMCERNERCRPTHRHDDDCDVSVSEHSIAAYRHTHPNLRAPRCERVWSANMVGKCVPTMQKSCTLNYHYDTTTYLGDICTHTSTCWTGDMCRHSGTATAGTECISRRNSVRCSRHRRGTCVFLLVGWREGIRLRLEMGDGKS